MRVALYARYSSDNQRPTSIEDQLRDLRAECKKRGWKIVKEYTDYEVSGAFTYERPGFQALMDDAKRNRFDVVFADTQDRFNRSLTDSSALFDKLQFLGIKLITLLEGEIDLMKTAFNGLKNQQYLETLRHQTRRGMRGVVENGKSGGGISFGYRAVQGVIGDREINEAEAIIVRRIFTMYLAGASSKVIAKTLNAEGVPGPRGSSRWNPSTIHGNAELGLGILHNELYVGRMVWNRQRWIKNPETGNRVSRINPKSEWVTKDVPELRIVTDAQWNAVKARVSKRSEVYKQTGNPNALANSSRHLFSGLTKCGVCGAGFVMHHGRLVCFGQKDCSSCTNTMSIGREEVEQRVLAALQTKLMRKDLFEEFCREFTAETNRLRMAASASAHAAQNELERVRSEAQKLLRLMLDKDIDCKDDFNALKARQRELEAVVENTPDPAPLLHPKMADTYQRKVERLVSALKRTDSRAQASDDLRELIDAIILTPDPLSGVLKIDLKGDLAALLTLAQDGKKTETRDFAPVLQVIAGGGCVLNNAAA